MEVTFKKNLSKSYMCVREQREPLEQYELQMLEEYHVPGLLSVQTVFAEGERQYLYDISGKQQIEDYFSGRKIGYGMLKRFLISIQQICQRAPEYLLREEGICLEMEFIYVNLDDGSLWFTYLPFYEKSLPDAFAACMEQILRKLDHQDKLAVELGYLAYQLSTRENADIGGILEAVLAENLPVNEEAPGKLNIDTYIDKKPQERDVPEESENKTSIQKIGLAGRVKAWQDKWKEIQMQIAETVKSGKRLKLKRKLKPGENPKPSEELQMIDFSEDAGTFCRPTEILSVRQMGAMGKLVYRGIHQCADIQIEGESFLLGKNSEQAHGVISAEGVSRLHARISRKENKYFIEDLNSTNGTYLNDTALEYREPQELKVNDKIRFGVEEYEFF